MRILIKSACVVNEGTSEVKDVLIVDDRIAKVAPSIEDSHAIEINAEGLLLIPGAIDDQVHFREPGLTHKATIHTESIAAAAGGVTSFMEMPNTNPQTTTQQELENKYAIGAKDAVVNYSFFMGATNTNIEDVLATDASKVCGVKVFMGSSTGNMLVDNETALNTLFSQCPMLIATHCEDESTIRANTEAAIKQFGEDIPIEQHPIIRSAEACYKSSSMAVALAKKHNTRLHILHISTAKELSLFSNKLPLGDKRITAEACVHHLWFSDEDYKELGTKIKWNPAVKSKTDRAAILNAVITDVIDVMATDHAPHTKDEKSNSYLKAPSGGPLIQHYLPALFDLCQDTDLTVEHLVKKTSHDVARCFNIKERGFIREGYYADLVLVDPKTPYKVTQSNILYKCGWSPFEDHTFSHTIHTTFVNGKIVYSDGTVDTGHRGMRLNFKG
ncbi:MAG: dihydroorotase [Sphingobacteriales bacterium]|jgi:dihydroorotase